ncbi:MAG: hypothetical protein ACTHOP_00650, partial [Mesorhizobium sp.]
SLIAKAMKSANADLGNEVVERTAKLFTRAIVNRAHSLDDMAHRFLGAQDVEKLVDVLRQEGGLDKADAEALLKTFQKSPDAGRDTHLKRRLLLDESQRLVNPAKKDGTVDEFGLGITDLLDLDARSIFQRYTRATQGRIALARYRYTDPQTGELLINGITSDGEFTRLVDLARKKNADLISEGKMTPAQADGVIKRMEFTYAAIMGRPLNGDFENTGFGWTLRALRKFNFVRILNQAGFANVAETAMPVASLGVKAAFSNFPALQRVVTQDGEAILKSGLAHDLEAALGLGTSRIREAGGYHFDELMGIHEGGALSWQGWTDRQLDRAGRVTSTISGLGPIEVMQQRLTAATIVQKFADMAHGAGGISAKRLADLGLDEGMTSRIMAMFKEPGNFTYDTGALTGRKVVRANFDSWSDKEAREAFLAATWRFTNQLIQRNDIGNLAMWMSKPLAKTMLQFRLFSIGAWGKQTLKAANFRDGMAVRQIAATSALASLVYIVQQKILAIGRSDRKQFEEDRLSWQAIAEATFARSSAASILPMLLDTGVMFTGAQPMFGSTRTSGQPSDVLWGNPTMGLIDDLRKASVAAFGIGRDGPWSQQEVRAVTRVLPFANAVPLVVGLNALIGPALPEHPARR